MKFVIIVLLSALCSFISSSLRRSRSHRLKGDNKGVKPEIEKGCRDSCKKHDGWLTKHTCQLLANEEEKKGVCVCLVKGEPKFIYGLNIKDLTFKLEEISNLKETYEKIKKFMKVKYDLPK